MIKLFLCSVVIVSYVWVLIAIRTVSSTSSGSSRTLSGDVLNSSAVSYLVYISIGKTYCTGTVISEFFVLTAAHCFDRNRKDITVYYGVNSISELDPVKSFKFQELYIHPKYKRKAYKSIEFVDLALVELEYSILDGTEGVSSVTLSGYPWPMNEYFQTLPRNCKSIGYNKRNKNNDQITVSEYKATHGENVCKCVESLYGICLKSKAESNTYCGEHFGSPLICDGQAVGVISFIVNKKGCNAASAKEIKCGDENIIIVAIFLCPFLEWIGDIVTSDDIPDRPLSCAAVSVHKLLNIAIYHIIFIVTIIVQSFK